MKKNSTKRALLTAVLCLMLCVSMLVGTTYAWFTDSVTTGVNTIQSGTLKVDMVDAANRSLVGKTLSFRDKNGSKDILWEPGATFELDKFAVVNNGNLALKYKIVINGLAKEGDDVSLLDVIDFTVNGTPLASFNAVDVILKPGERSDLINLAGKMRETAGNEYQNKSISGVSITVYATQATVENDSIDNTYDAGAEYLELPVAKVASKGAVTIPADHEEMIGDTLPSWQGLTLIGGELDLDADFVFTAPATVDPAFADWHADFEVSIDHDIQTGDLILAGMYDAFLPDTWVAFANPMDVDANTPIRLLTSVGAPWTYEGIVTQVKVFECGVSSVNIPDGATLNVSLKLYETENGVETGTEYVIGTYSYTFGVEEEDISDVKVVGNANEVEAAVNNTTGDVILVLSDDIDEAIVLDQKDRNITIDGNGKEISAPIKLDGNSTIAADETMVIRNVNFTTDVKDLTFIDANSADGADRYAHNVVFESCTFTATGAGYRTAVATKLRQCFDITFKNCIGTGLHSFAQVYGGANHVFDNITLTDCKNGISVGTSLNNVIKNCKIASAGSGSYGVRADGEVVTTLTLENNKLSAFAPVLVRYLSKAYTLNADATNTLTASNPDGYQIVLSTADYDDDTAATAPTGAYVLNAADSFKVYKG